jgi:hypothetical protein
MWEARAAGRRMIAPTSELGPPGLRWQEVALTVRTAASNAPAAEAGLRRRKSHLTQWTGDNAGADYPPESACRWRR